MNFISTLMSLLPPILPVPLPAVSGVLCAYLGTGSGRGGAGCREEVQTEGRKEEGRKEGSDAGASPVQGWWTEMTKTFAWTI